MKTGKKKPTVKEVMGVVQGMHLYILRLGQEVKVLQDILSKYLDFNGDKEVFMLHLKNKDDKKRAEEEEEMISGNPGSTSNPQVKQD